MAEINTPVLRNVFKRTNLDEQILSLRKSSIFARKSSINARKVLARKTLVSAKAQQTEKRINFLFESRNRRRRREELVEANATKSGYVSSTVRNAVDRGKGFLGKIMDSLGFLLLGWLVNQLPRILAFIDTLRFRITNIIDAGKSMIRNIGNIIRGIGGVVSQATQNIMNFDFQDFADPNGKFQSKIKELDGNIQALGNDFEDAKINVLNITTPPTEEERRQKEEEPGKATRPEEPKVYYGPGGDPSGSGLGQAQQRPETQTTPTPTPAPTPAPTPSGTPGAGQTKEMRALLNVIAFAEGTAGEPNYGYNTHFGYDQTADLSAHPNIVKRGGRYASAAFGRYQFMPRTWIRIGGACKAGGPIPYTPGMSMSPANQDKGAVILAKQRGVTQAMLQKEGFSIRVSALLSGEWASIPNAQGRSAYDQPVRKYNQLKALYEKEVGKPKTTPQVQAPPPKVVPAPTPPTEVQQPQQQPSSQPPFGQPSRQGGLNLIPQRLSDPGGFIQGGSGSRRGPDGTTETQYATHFHIDGPANLTKNQRKEIREVAFHAIRAMFARGSTVYLGSSAQSLRKGMSDSALRNAILIEQNAHAQRSSPAVDIQENNPNIQRTFPSQPGSKTTFPFAIGKVYMRGGYGREAMILGTDQISVSHGAAGSVESPVSVRQRHTRASIQQSTAKGMTIAMVPVPVETEVQVPVSSGSAKGFSKSSGTDPLNSIRNITTMYT